MDPGMGGTQGLKDLRTCGLGDDVDFGTCGLEDIHLGTMWTLGRVG